ncbi:MAG: hypothetical protein HQL91_06445 [Magnetococcales bacterium]|nr:hypothetical protein [Magnetococcales bacterium]
MATHYDDPYGAYQRLSERRKRHFLDQLEGLTAIPKDGGFKQLAELPDRDKFIARRAADAGFPPDESKLQKYPDFSLTHGQAAWVLWKWIAEEAEEHDWSESPPEWFFGYLKYLRRAGIPFADGEMEGGTGNFVSYQYHHLMEMAMALLLKWHGVANKDVAGFIVSLRYQLRILFAQAYVERFTGKGSPVSISRQIGDEEERTEIEGVFLDLGITYHREKGFEYNTDDDGNLKLLSPWELINHITDESTNGDGYLGIICLSAIAMVLVDYAEKAPEFKRGPR